MAPVTEPLIVTLRPRRSGESEATLSTTELLPRRTAAPMIVLPSAAVLRLPRVTRPSSALAPRMPSTFEPLFR